MACFVPQPLGRSFELQVHVLMTLITSINGLVQNAPDLHFQEA